MMILLGLPRRSGPLQSLILCNFAHALCLLVPQLYRSNLVAIRDLRRNLLTLGLDLFGRLYGIIGIARPRDRDGLSDKSLCTAQVRIADVLFVGLA